MASKKQWSEEACISLILRLAFASLFTATAVSKFLGGLAAVTEHIQTRFQDTWLPPQLVELHSQLIPYIEAAIPIWLILGLRLRWAWIFTALFLTTLAFGMTVAKQHETAAHNYFYVLMACAGLYFSRYDSLNLEGKK